MAVNNMVDTSQTLLSLETAGLTLIGGVILFFIGRTVEALVFAPFRDYKKQAQLTAAKVDFYSNRLTNYFSDSPKADEAKFMRQMTDDLRNVATLFRARYRGIAGRKLLVAIKWIPSEEDANKVFSNLIFLHNNLPRASRDDRRDPKFNAIDMNHTKMNEINKILGNPDT